MATNDRESALASARERILSIDVLRGIAILGILVMNIRDFAMPLRAFEDPTFPHGSVRAIDVGVWTAANLLFQDKMIAILSILFGAGLILGSRPSIEAERERTKMLVKRHLALLLFGAAHAYLIWFGDILNTYALLGLVLLLLRRRSPLTLLISGVIVYGIGCYLRQNPEFWRDSIRPHLREYYPSMQRPMTQDEAMHGTWWDLFRWRAWLNWYWHIDGGLAFNFWRCGGLMLVGMAMTRAGIFAASFAKRRRLLLLALGYGIGLPLAFLVQEIERAEHAALSPIIGTFGLDDYARFLQMIAAPAVALGHVGLVLTLVRGDRLGPLSKGLAAAGRMALTLYLLQSLICSITYDGWALGYYGRMSFAAQGALILAVWAVQIPLATAWLRRHSMGPMERLWRRLYAPRPLVRNPS